MHRNFPSNPSRVRSDVPFGDVEQRRRVAALGTGRAHQLLDLQRQAGNRAVTAVVQRQAAETRERDREITAATRDHVPGDDAAWFQSDWAGRAILARYLSGAGDWEIANDPAWAAYMRASTSLQSKLRQHAHYLIANVAALGFEEGVVQVDEQFPVEIENGEGIVGYQYLHGTNADVGGFQINGWARMVPKPPPDPSANQTSADRRVHYYLEYHWNDIIDPNPQYGTDRFKSRIAYAISAGAAKSYNISIIWSGEGVVTVGPNGEVTAVAPTSDTGETLNGYPLR